MNALIGAVVLGIILITVGGPIGALLGGGILFWVVVAVGIWAILSLMGLAIFGLVLVAGGFIFWCALMLFYWIFR